MVFYSTITCVILIETVASNIISHYFSRLFFSFGSLILSYMITWQCQVLFLIKKVQISIDADKKEAK